jgi:hypothetical protein
VANIVGVCLAGMALLFFATMFLGPRSATEAWRKGAEGEERLGRRLDKLERHGFHVLHDLQVPGSRANVDQLVIGRTGVFLVDAKNYSGHLTLSKGTLWHGRHPMGKLLATTRWEAERVSDALLSPGAPPATRVRPVMCVLGAEMPRTRFDLDGVLLVSGGVRLVKEIGSGRTRLSEKQVTQLYVQACRVLSAAVV